MGKIKRHKLPQLRAVSQGDIYDRAFWDEFYWQDEASARRSMLADRGVREEVREVTVTIKDSRTGEEWEFQGVKMVYEGGRKATSH